MVAEEGVVGAVGAEARAAAEAGREHAQRVQMEASTELERGSIQSIIKSRAIVIMIWRPPILWTEASSDEHSR